MPEPFKNLFNPSMILQMGIHFERAFEDFDTSTFIKIATDQIRDRELKERSNQITTALESVLPSDFSQSVKVIKKTLHPETDRTDLQPEIDEQGICGWAIMPIGEYVSKNGIQNIEQSMELLRELTMRFSAEFAVRPFLNDFQEQALPHLYKWASDPNRHVRRLASEGARPRLPWGIRLTKFDKDPTPILPILEKLKDDPEEYVRRSVANSLNDIAKQHPNLVAQIAKNWLKKATTHRKRLVKHACRSLIKQGHKKTLEAFGYGEPFVKTVLSVPNDQVTIGNALNIQLELSSTKQSEQNLILDYVIHHQKANGETSPKTFKWKELTLAAGKTVKLEKKHQFKPVTTRVYYSGTHHVEIQINGESFDTLPFNLNLK